MKRLPHSLFALLVLLQVQTGCSFSVLQLRDQMDLHRGEFRQKLADKKDLAAKFLACTKHPHDEPLSERHDAGSSPEPLSLQTPEGEATSVRPRQPSSMGFAGAMTTKEPPSPSSPTSSMTWTMTTRTRASIWTNSNR